MGKKVRRDYPEMNNVEDLHARHDHRNNKKLSIHDLTPIKPLNEPQKQMFESYFTDNFIVANGSAGTGKSFCSIFLALNDVLSKDRPQKKIIIVRSAVPSREIGHLPGTEDEKLEPYEAPYKDIFAELLGRDLAYDKMKKKGIVKFVPTSFIRGLTWDDAVIVVDEVQNMTFYEINSVITRVGANSKLIVIGDQIQTDLYRRRNDKSGIEEFIRIADRMSEFDHVVFTSHDIVRSAFVKSWICALEESNIDL
jgi:phosphate starvation-inducible protein PhoH